jgi:hypothetical protein
VRYEEVSLPPHFRISLDHMNTSCHRYQNAACRCDGLLRHLGPGTEHRFRRSCTRPVESYATTDVGMVADQAPAEDTLIVHDDLMIIEPVDQDDGPVPTGELSHHVLVTSLHQRTMPMIRYRIDDRIRVAAPAGRRYPPFTRIASIDGRADDLFRYSDVTDAPAYIPLRSDRPHALGEVVDAITRC